MIFTHDIKLSMVYLVSGFIMSPYTTVCICIVNGFLICKAYVGVSLCIKWMNLVATQDSVIFT